MEPTRLFTWFQEDSWYLEENVISGVWILSFYCIFDILAFSYAKATLSSSEIPSLQLHYLLKCLYETGTYGDPRNLHWTAKAVVWSKTILSLTRYGRAN